jgi:hypothetical protein
MVDLSIAMLNYQRVPDNYCIPTICDKPIDNIVMDKPMEYSNGLPMDLPMAYHFQMISPIKPPFIMDFP